ncbi:ATP-binding protein [Nocardioides sp.]|uniref:sensor histidine kinase n=1 Tax=Nocardioides sp. TaxID=35761 RepID=UPI0031FE5545|nr:ATP-binding region, ATPase domain protein [Nocardioides sp.]
MLRSPLAQFLFIGVLTVVGIIITSDYLAGRSAADEALAEAGRTTEILARSVAEPDFPKALLGDEVKYGVADKYDREVLKRLKPQEPNVEHIIIWRPDGRVVYADPLKLVGHSFALDAEQQQTLSSRSGTRSSPADPNSAQNRLIGDTDGLVQIYTRMEAPTGEPLLFEAYYSFDEIDKRQQEIYGSFRWLAIGPVLLLMGVVTIMLTFLTRQITSAGTERERLLRSAIDASDAERRRIARDLHDGVVQDLAGTTYSISAVARDAGTPTETRASLQGATVALRASLRGLRSLLAEIHPPELHAEGLAAALADLIAPASAAGIQASVSVEGAEIGSDAGVALVWRVAQEAVRNAIRHSGASTLAVTVRRDDTKLVLEVVDDGAGFDPAVRDPDRFGLRGLRSLVTDIGGKLEVRSAVGEGTTVRMEVDVQ